MARRLFDGLLLRSRLITICSGSCAEGAVPCSFSLLLATMLSETWHLAGSMVYNLYDQPLNLFLVASGTFAAVAQAGARGGKDARGDAAGAESVGRMFKLRSSSSKLVSKTKSAETTMDTLGMDIVNLGGTSPECVK